MQEVEDRPVQGSPEPQAGQKVFERMGQGSDLRETQQAGEAFQRVHLAEDGIDQLVVRSARRKRGLQLAQVVGEGVEDLLGLGDEIAPAALLLRPLRGIVRHAGRSRRCSRVSRGFAEAPRFSG